MNTGYWQLLKQNKRVRLLWSAQVVSELGDWLNFVALMQLISKFSTSAQASGLLIILQMMPMVVFSPVAGMVADRFDRKHVMIIADLLRAGIVAGFLTIDSADELWLLYLLSALQFSLTSFFEPARSALLPNLADGEELVTANALTSVTWSLMLAIGGALGGVIAGLAGNRAAFIVDAASFLASAAILLRLNTNKTEPGAHEPHKERDSSLRPALRYLRQRPRVFAVMLVKSGICATASGVWLLSVVYGQRIFPIGAEGSISVGLLYGAHGLGALAGATFTGRFFRNQSLDPVRVILWAFVLRSICFLLWGASPNIWLAALAIMSVTACGSLLWVMSTTLLQRLTPDEIRGRLFALEYMALTLTMAACIWAIGLALDDWQLSAPLTTMATAAVAALIALAWLAVVLRWRQWQNV